MEESHELIKQRKEKLRQIREEGINPYPYSFEKTDNAKDILEEHKKLGKEEKTNKKVSVAGRVMTLRLMGKACFGNIQDESGQIQFYVREDDVGKEVYRIFKKIDLGDIIGLKGTIFRTKMGEISIYTHNFELLSKGLRPLPEKFHGLKDMEIRYRQRYLDLISNPEVKEVFVKRSKIIKAMREFLDEKGFLEVETPVLQKMYGGANARPFKSFLHELKMDIYMRISNELYLKKLVTGGFEKVYEFAKDFRNESIDRTHNPEFTQMECYWAYVDYNAMMKLTEDMVEFIAKKVLGTTKIEYQGTKIDLKAPWKRMTVKEAIKKYAEIDIDEYDDEGLQDLLKGYNIEYGEFSRGLAIGLLFEELCEAKIVQPTFIMDHPKETTPLCKIHRKDKNLIERFEPYIFGMEIGNAYSELNDPEVQRKLLEEQARNLMKGSEEAHPMDEDFITSMEFGMPPMGGLGIGIDRLVMILTNSSSIRDVILFPFMKDIED
ncbi:MAG: lysine--tRNA ligase [Candidatus Nanoarchaeia archaeon]|nr:lysine--tRNA ligase [Candidatus Nanoarchaeia archaeon]